MTADELAPSKGTSDENADAREEDGRVGLHNKSDEKIVEQILMWWKDSADRRGDISRRRTEVHKMLDNEQWAEEDVKARGRRPTLTFNMLLSILAAVEGQERNNRQEMKYYGRGGEDEPSAEKWNKLLKWVIDANEGEYELSEQFHEMIASGEGWITPEIDYLDDPEGVMRLEFVDNDEIFDDPYSKKPTGTDARFRIRVKMLTVDEGEALWPDKFEATIKASALANELTEETDGRGYPDIYLTPEKSKGVKRYDAKDKTWAVVQCFWWQIEQGWVALNEQTGLLEELTDEEFEERKAERQQEQMSVLQQVMSGQAVLAPQGVDPMQTMMPMMPQPAVAMPPALQAEQRPIKRVYEAFVVYDALLECGPIREKLKMFPIVPMRGIRRKSKNDWVGILNAILDSQRQHNVEQSILVELMQLMPKSSWMGPKGSFHNKADWETGVAQPGKILEYNANRGAKPEPITPPQIPRHLMELAFSRPQSMREISGVNVELTGIRQGSDAGVVMEQRAKAAQTVLAPLFDNARRSRKVLGKVLLAYMQAHLSVGRQIRILGPDGAELITVGEDMLTNTYDMQVDETNHTVNDRIATLNLMQTTLPALVDKGVPIPPSIVELLPMPTKIRDEWKRMIHWQLTLSGALPPEGWEPGMPPPMMGGPPPSEPPA